MKRFIKNPKKGAAIELALLVIFIAVALSTLIVSFTLTGNKIKQQSFSTLTRQTKADEIMEAYLARDGLIIDEDYQIQELPDGKIITVTLLAGDESWLNGIIINEDYKIQELDDGEIITVTLLTDDEIWLTVKIQSGKIIQWKY